MRAKRSQDEQPPETLEERWLLEAQTARNLEALGAEQSGDIEQAIALYERRGALDQAERVLRRAIDVFAASQRRTAADRRATLRVFKNRLKQVLVAQKRAPG